MRVFDRLRLPGLLLGALAFALVGCGGGGGGSDSSDAEDFFAVIQEVPTNGQEVAGDLSDVGGVFEIKFSTDLDEDTILDPSNPFNGLSADLNMLDNTLARVAGTPEVKGKYFRFIPPSTGLSPQQYTVTVTRNITSLGGQALPTDYFTSFTVGPDDYEPIIRRTYPVQNQSNVARDTEIVVTFNESLEPGSVNTQTVLVQDGGQNPPVTINGTISLENNGFEIHFTPDPTTNMPPDTTVIVTLVGGNGGIADKTAGKPFMASDTGSQSYTLQFNTTSGGDPINQFAVASCYFVDNKSFGVIDIAAYTGNAPPMPGSNGRQVLDNSRRKVGAPGEIILDPRVNGNGDTFAYIVDMNSSTVAVVNTFNSKVVGRIQARGPRGLATIGGSMWVTEYSADTVQVYSMRQAAPGTDYWSDSQDPFVGSAVKTATTQVGRGPVGAAHAPDQPYTFITNALEGTSSIMQDADDTVVQTWQVGDFPQDVSCTLTFTIGWFALVTNLGGGVSNPGSASLWWSANAGVQSWLLTGLQNPRGLSYDYGIRWYIANSGGNTVAEATLGTTATTVTLTLTNNFHTGKGPQNVAMDPANGIYAFSSDQGDGIVSVNNTADLQFQLPYIEVPGVKWVATLLNQ